MENSVFLMGHASDNCLGTGVTVILAPEGAVAGVSVRGAAPGTRETDLLKPMNTVQKANAIVLSGGSAFGLESCSGVMQYLYEQGCGFLAGDFIVPIVAGAVLFDLSYKEFAFPDKKMGYEAAQNAAPLAECFGSVGAGTGATIGKILGPKWSSKGGLGCFTIHLGDAWLMAVTAVNAIGDVVDNGVRVAGIKHEKTVMQLLLDQTPARDLAGQNTTIGCVLTNVTLSKEEINKLADIAHDGLALAIQPVHTMSDGDTMFAMSSAEVSIDFLSLQAACVEAVRRSVISSVNH